MKIEWSKNNEVMQSITTYTDDEWEFIDSLPLSTRRNVMRGMIDIYALGYKPKQNNI